MKSLVIYDSEFGNTEKVARAVAAAIPAAELKTVAQSRAEDLSGIKLLVVGSPTQGGRPTPAIASLLQQLPDQALAGVNVAAFDTRFSPADHGPGLRLVMRIFGFAAGRIERLLTAKGGHEVLPPEGFIVADKVGPLRSGELERAARWAQSLVTA